VNRPYGSFAGGCNEIRRVDLSTINIAYSGKISGFIVMVCWFVVGEPTLRNLNIYAVGICRVDVSTIGIVYFEAICDFILMAGLFLVGEPTLRLQ